MVKLKYLTAALAIFFISSVGAAMVFIRPAIAAAPAATSTQPQTSGQALEIAPPVMYVTANPGQTVKQNIEIRNISSTDLVVTGETDDFVASGESGTPKILLNQPNEKDPYSLKTWINPPASLLLVPKEIKTVSITIHVPANASPGGHYGVIRFTGAPPNLKGQGVSLSASLGTLVLLTVNGKITDNLSVKEFSVNKNGKTGTFFDAAPLNFVERFNNLGNVHEQPTGLLTVTDMFGKKVATLRINAPPHNILPQSVRKFQESMDKTVIGNKRLFGRYHAVMNVTYANNKKLTAEVTFWVIPWKIIVIIIAALIAAFFILRFAIRRYNRAIVNRAGGGNHHDHRNNHHRGGPPRFRR